MSNVIFWQNKNIKEGMPESESTIDWNNVRKWNSIKTIFRRSFWHTFWNSKDSVTQNISKFTTVIIGKKKKR